MAEDDHLEAAYEELWDEPEPEEYNPGPEVDDEGGMSEWRHNLAEQIEDAGRNWERYHTGERDS